MAKRIFSWMSPKLEICLTSKYGVGDLPVLEKGKKVYKKKRGKGKAVFARTPIRKGEILFVMGGYILSIADENRLKGIVADKPIELSPDFSIGPITPSDLRRMPQHYVNHSCDPNAGFDGQLFMVAMRSIRKGEEIAYDYAMIMHPNSESNSYFSFNCLCASDRCRKVIQENDWRMKELQNRYDGYFQYFLQKKIDKIKKK